MGLKLVLSDTFKTKVVDEGFNPIYGARPLRRAITKFLEDTLPESLLTVQAREGEHIIVDLDRDLQEVLVLRDQEAV